MALGSLAGHARVNPNDPISQAECDRCREWYNINQLTWQYQWSGARLINTGLLVCRRKCLDIPQPQYKVLILPGDPVPTKNARPSPDTTPPGLNPQQPLGYYVPPHITLPTDPYNQGFTPFLLGGVPPAVAPWEGVAGTPQPGGFPPGFPTTKPAVLAAMTALTGIPTGGLIDRSITITQPGATLPLVPAAAVQRARLLIYSPVAPMSGFSKGSAILGSSTTLMLGPGMAWFWATVQGLGQVYQGALTAVGLQAGMPVWAWDDAGQYLTDDLGNIITDDLGNPIILT